jgi:hypothetical protein
MTSTPTRRRQIWNAVIAILNEHDELDPPSKLDTNDEGRTVLTFGRNGRADVQAWADALGLRQPTTHRSSRTTTIHFSTSEMFVPAIPGIVVVTCEVEEL